MILFLDVALRSQPTGLARGRFRRQMVARNIIGYYISV